MQNSQDLNLYEIGKIVIPSLVSLIVPFITYWLLSRKMADYQKDISKEIESYKIELSMELENHKVQLQSDFQTKLYEFQTRFLLYHQQKAEAIKEIYAGFAKIEVQIKKISAFTSQLVLFDADFENVKISEKAEEIKQESLDILNNLEISCSSNKIYLDSVVSNEISRVFQLQKELVDENITQINARYNLGRGVMADSLKNELFKRKLKTNEKIESEALAHLKANLENQFRQLISVGNPNNQHDKHK